MRFGSHARAVFCHARTRAHTHTHITRTKPAVTFLSKNLHPPPIPRTHFTTTIICFINGINSAYKCNVFIYVIITVNIRSSFIAQRETTLVIEYQQGDWKCWPLLSSAPFYKAVCKQWTAHLGLTTPNIGKYTARTIALNCRNNHSEISLAITPRWYLPSVCVKECSTDAVTGEKKTGRYSMI